jgi:hypothetical protein
VPRNGQFPRIIHSVNRENGIFSPEYSGETSPVDIISERAVSSGIVDGGIEYVEQALEKPLVFNKL